MKTALFPIIFLMKIRFLALISSLFLLLQPLSPLFSQKTKTPSPINPDRIEIVRDSFGVPHIFAATDAEVAFGLAWATMEDDAETPQWMLYALKNHMGRFMGIEGARIDFAVQFMGVRETVEKNYATQVGDHFKGVLEGYCAGINAYGLAHPEEIHYKSALPITPQDILTGYMLGLGLMAGMEGTISKLVSGEIADALPEEKVIGTGSNAYAMAPSRTIDGGTYLAINAHQPLEGLLSWYEAHVCSEEGWNISGAMFHGSPSIFLGTNENLGWGHTTGTLDAADVFNLEMHPQKKLWYKFDDQWLKLEKKRAKLIVRLGKKPKKGIILPVGKRFYKSVYGPTMITKRGTFSMRMPALMRITAAEQWFQMNKAKNWEEFRAALNIQGHAHQNITYADRKGNIFFLANGLMPKRNPDYNWEKVVPGNTSRTLWKDFHLVSDLVQFKNPDAGYVFNTNQSAFMATSPAENLSPRDFDPTIGYQTNVNNRSIRSYEIIESTPKFSFSDFKALKYDITYPDSMVFLRKFDLSYLYMLEPEAYPDIADAIERIRAFDKTADSLDPNFAVMMIALYYAYDHGSGEREQLLCDSKEECLKLWVESVRQAKKHMLQYFGKLDVPLGTVQVHQRGDVCLPVDGGPDAIRAVYSRPWEDGKYRNFLGDGYHQLVNFSKDGPEIWAISPYGASNKPDSPHYTDQMQMYVQHKLRKISLRKEEVYKSAERIYHPR